MGSALAWRLAGSTGTVMLTLPSVTMRTMLAACRSPGALRARPARGGLARVGGRFLLGAALAALLSHGHAHGSRLDLIVDREAGNTLTGTLFEIPGDTPDAPRLSIGIQSIVQSGMPSYSELLTIHVRHGGDVLWRDLGQPFERGHYVWLVALDNQLIAIDRQDIALPRKLQSREPPRWEALAGAELVQLEEYLWRSRSALRRPRLYAGAFSVQMLDAGKLEICRLPPSVKGACRTQTIPVQNDIVYAVASDERGTVLFANEGWFRLEPDGAVRAAWLQSDEPHLSNQIYTAVRTNRGVLLGHYPTGNVMRMVVGPGGRVSAEPMPGKPPHTAPARRSDREVQSLARYGGHLLAGVWPWGELYSFEAASGWTLVRRFFAAPQITDGLAPYADSIIGSRVESGAHVLRRRVAALLPGWARTRFAWAGPMPEDDPDVWGQRITQLVPLGTGLYIATGNKSGEHVADWVKFLPAPALAGYYGKVYEMIKPGNLACNLPAGRQRVALTLAVAGQRLEVWVDGKLLCSLSDESVTLAATLLQSAGTTGQGMYGELLGGRVRNASSIAAKAGSPSSAAKLH